MKFSKKIVWLSALAGVILLTSVMTKGIWKERSQGDSKAKVVGTGTDAEMKLTDMEYTEMEKGRRAWTLKADEAKYYQDEQKTSLKKVRLRFFLQNGEEIQLPSLQGILYAGRKDIELWGGVHAVFPNGYEMSTEKAYYRHEQNSISSQSSISVTGPDLELTGRNWKYQIPERRALLEGRVQATLMLTLKN